MTFWKPLILLWIAAPRCAWAVSLQLYPTHGPFVSPSTSSLEAVSGTVEAVRIDRLNVFDPSVPGEDWWIFRVANAIHIPTKPNVVRREILFNRGDAWDPLSALESERNLRATGFIRKAEIRPTQYDGKIDIMAHTQDSWTLAPQASIGTEGGDRYLIYGIEESNLLGYGKDVSLLHAEVGSQVRDELRYDDGRLWGSRVHWTSLFGATPNGTEVGQILGQPFFSHATPYSWNLVGARVIQQDIMYQDAAESTRFNQDFRSLDGSYGRHFGDDGILVQRAFAGFHYERDAFLDDPMTAPGTLPAGRILSGPTLGYTWIQPRYIKETYINRMQRVEDFNLGNELAVSAGAMTRAFGSDANRWDFFALDQQGLGLGPDRFALGQVGAQGRLRNGNLENTIYYGSVNLFIKTWLGLPQTWVAHFEANTTQALDQENQIVLGGATGLRGYKNYAFTGSRSLLLNLEDRLFIPKEFLHLFYMGGVAFFDSGAVVPQGTLAAWNHAKSDLGVGLRFSSTRSTSGDVFRVDVAYALNSGPGNSRWVVGIRGGQAFDIFTSTNREVLRTPLSGVTDDSAGVRLRGRQ